MIIRDRKGWLISCRGCMRSVRGNIRRAEPAAGHSLNEAKKEKTSGTEPETEKADGFYTERGRKKLF